MIAATIILLDCVRLLKLPEALEFGTQAAITAASDPVLDPFQKAAPTALQKAEAAATAKTEKNTAALAAFAAEQISKLDIIANNTAARQHVFSL